MEPLVIIPARGGSKRLPGKNIKPLNGKPLIHYTIEAARQLFSDDHICVSTDDKMIKKVAEDTGLSVPFIRPKELARDSSGSREVLLHAISFYEERGYKPETIILLQPTSPLRNSAHIKEALQLYSSDLDMVVSVKETKTNPYRVLYEESEEGYLEKSKDPERLDNPKLIPPVWEFNGAIYVINSRSLIEQPISKFKKIRKYVMPAEVSIDIDTEADWKYAQYLINKAT
ncbi:MAG: acylneuraminate cytidylyltransferase family protein [Balneolaceae bacterium]|nr:acylneuraminate cytidylyltransferase family protein [Balneolaceae bacterium]MCH8550200.1 acylneuraminate cytidylyltransferase family protein [Balneolaceae bacterium]